VHFLDAYPCTDATPSLPRFNASPKQPTAMRLSWDRRS